LVWGSQPEGSLFRMLPLENQAYKLTARGLYKFIIARQAILYIKEAW